MAAPCSTHVHFAPCTAKPPANRERAGYTYPKVAQVKDAGDRSSFDLCWPTDVRFDELKLSAPMTISTECTSTQPEPSLSPAIANFVKVQTYRSSHLRKYLRKLAALAPAEPSWPMHEITKSRHSIESQYSVMTIDSIGSISTTASNA